MMGCRQQPLHKIIRQGVGQELAANVAPRHAGNTAIAASPDAWEEF